MMRFNYAEYKDDGITTWNRERGVIPGLSFRFAQRRNAWEWEGTANYHYGRVDYTGQTNTGAPHSTFTNEEVFDVALRLGRWYEGSYPIMPYAGLGYRIWDRDILPTGSVSGLFESYRWNYAWLGAKIVAYQQGASKLMLDIGWIRPIDPVMDISGAYGNPKNLSDAFRKFVEYDKRDDSNTVAAYIDHEYRTIQNIRTPKAEGGSAVELAPEDRFFSYKHYLDGNGELIDPVIMLIIAKAMVRNKPDSYCMSWDLRTTGISQMVHDLISLYVHFGVDPSARVAYQNDGYQPPKKPGTMRRAWDKLFGK